MRKFAKLLSLILAVLTVVSVCSFTTSALQFEDIDPAKNEELATAVELLSSLGIVKGTSEVTFSPKTSVTRQQMAAFVYRLMKGGKSVEGGENFTKFTDLKDPTFYYMISWASDNGIIKGVSDTKFDPEGKIILQDAYVMVVRALGYEKDEPLAYPYGYIDIAEQIGLDKNLDPEITYTDKLLRSDMAIIIYNAFYADMNETYQKSVILPDAGGMNFGNRVITKEVPETVCHKIYGVEKVERRVVATPSYAVNISEIGTGTEYANTANIKPLAGDTIDEELIQTAAVCAEYTTRLNGEQAVIKFEDLGLPGKADDYFLQDIVMFINTDGEPIAAAAKGTVKSPSSITLEVDKAHDSIVNYRDYSNKTKFYTGEVKFGEDSAYFFALPERQPNLVYPITPTSSDGEGRMTFTAGRLWWGDATSKITASDNAFQSLAGLTVNTDIRAAKINNHDKLTRYLGVAKNSGNYSLQYYDCNSDGVVDYYWLMPYTFGEVVVKSNERYSTSAMHTGDSSYRAVYNSEKNMPQIYISDDATVEGGKYEDGQLVFAYVAGPANYVRVADDGLNNTIETFTSKIVSYTAAGDDRKLDPKFENGKSIAYYWSGRRIVGHYVGTPEPTGISSIWTDMAAGDDFIGNWRESLNIGDTWTIVTSGGCVYLAWKQNSDDADLATQYAYLEYVNKDELQVAFKAGGIGMEGFLEYDNYVRAFIDGKYQIVKIAKENPLSASGKQDDNYFVDTIFDATGTQLCTYTVDDDGFYTFKPLDLKGTAADLLDENDSTKSYATRATDFSLQKVQNNIYKFVPAAGASSLPSELTINNMKYVTIDENTKIIVNYVDDEGDKNFQIYDGENLPDFDTSDPAMTFKNAVVVIKNRPESTTNETLSFIYCEIGGGIVDSASRDEDYRILLGNTETLIPETGATSFVYTVVNPYTAEITENVETAKADSAVLGNFRMYKLAETTGYIQNTTGGLKADLAYGSTDLLTLEYYDSEGQLIFASGVADPILVNDETIVTLFDRETLEYTVEDLVILEADANQPGQEIYFNNGETALTYYAITEEVDDEDFEMATLIIVVRG